MAGGMGKSASANLTSRSLNPPLRSVSLMRMNPARIFQARLDEFRPQLVRFYAQADRRKGGKILTTAALSTLLDKVVRLARIQILPSDLEEATEMFIEGVDLDSTATYDALINEVVRWFRETGQRLHQYYSQAGSGSSPQRSNQTPGQLFETAVMESIAVFSKLGPDSKMIVSVMQRELTRYREDDKRHLQVRPNRQDATPAELAGLKLIYDWYASQHTTFGPNPTFDDMSKDLHVMDLGTFLQFCRDFGLLGELRQQGGRRLSRAQCVEVFRTHAAYQREMDLSQFLSAVDSLALLYFTPEFDQQNPAAGAVSNRSVEEKRVMLYQLINCGSKRHIYNSRRQLGTSFTSNATIEPRTAFPSRSRSQKLKPQMRPLPPPPLQQSSFAGLTGMGLKKTRLAILQEAKDQAEQRRYKEAVQARRHLRHRLKQQRSETQSQSTPIVALKLRDLETVGYDRLQIKEAELQALIDADTDLR